MSIYTQVTIWKQAVKDMSAVDSPCSSVCFCQFLQPTRLVWSPDPSVDAYARAHLGLEFSNVIACKRKQEDVPVLGPLLF